MLILPAKAANACGVRRFQDRDHDGRAAHLRWLPVSNRQQCAVGDGFDEAAPSVLVEIRNVRMSSWNATSSLISGCVARE